MMTLTEILLLNLAAVILVMVAGWVISLKFDNVTIVDSLWGLGFVLIAWMTFFLSPGFAGRNTLITVLTTVWGLRLSIYLSCRNWGKGEDPRYGQWRQKSGARFRWVSLFKVFLLQAAFLWVISLVLQIGQTAVTPTRFTWLDLAGGALWLVGFFFESVGDFQLARFKAKDANKGKVMDRGLWAYTRHPNYFGEFMIWWGFYLITLSTTAGWWTVISPIVVSTVLLKMTGIPLTEQATRKSRPGYGEYIQRTNAFFPGLPRKEAM